MKKPMTKPLSYYVRRGIALTLRYYREHGFDATIGRIRYVLRPPKSHRDALKLIAKGDHASIFSHIYKTNIWGSVESRSGGGSTMQSTENIRRHLPIIFETFKVKTIIDAPCGDFYWMRLVNIGKDRFYTGIDVVPKLIAENWEKYGSRQHRFTVGNITRDPLPPGDLLICRDCFVHFGYENIFRALKNFVDSDIAFLLTTTHLDVAENVDIDTGHFRNIDLFSEPFCLPRNVLYKFDDFVPPHPAHIMCLWERLQIIEVLPEMSKRIGITYPKSRH